MSVAMMQAEEIRKAKKSLIATKRTQIHSRVNNFSELVYI